MECLFATSVHIKMPTYSYQCNSCKEQFELFYYIKDYVANPVCSCGSSDTYRDYIGDVSSVHSCIKKTNSELKTIGDLANRNRDSMSEDKKQMLYEKHNSYKEQKSEKELPKGMSRISKPKHKNKWTST